LAFSEQVEDSAVGFHNFAHTVVPGDVDINFILRDRLADSETSASEHCK
jgi:hypothetical protein